MSLILSSIERVIAGRLAIAELGLRSETYDVESGRNHFIVGPTNYNTFWCEIVHVFFCKILF